MVLTKKIKPIKLQPGEKVKVMPDFKSKEGQRYAITSHGRVISFSEKPTVGYFLALMRLRDYPGVHLMRKGKSQSFLVHRLVAEHFLKRPSKQHKYVIHLDFNPDNNHVDNLKWVTLDELRVHLVSNPKQIKPNRTNNGQKLTAERVKQIKRRLKEGATFRETAKEFNLSEMHIYRIKKGICWSWVKA
ncbi:MAG: HNH endonuclease [Cyclobacteriaceae bacterium]|nr:HNH endonuclease [Cyclobacteriaceae bacterium]MDW8331700.1 HNH endonuclease [Cyclobacteriaceae bacterium]